MSAQQLCDKAAFFTTLWLRTNGALRAAKYRNKEGTQMKKKIGLVLAIVMCLLMVLFMMMPFFK